MRASFGAAARAVWVLNAKQKLRVKAERTRDFKFKDIRGKYSMDENGACHRSPFSKSRYRVIRERVRGATRFFNY